jgi:hypothetical protein
MNKQFNVYDNLSSPKVKNYTTIEEWFSLIKESKHSAAIVAARPFGKKHPEYEKPKSKIPAITYNFTFKGWKNNTNITGATGFLYIDVDDLSYDINTLDKTKIFAYYKSFGGTGYSIIVQVDGLTLDNYSDTCTAIVHDLDLTQFYDTNAAKATQFNVLSYDPDIFINYDSFVFESINNFSPLSMVLEEEEEAYNKGGGELLSEGNRNIRFNNLNEMYVDGDYTVDWNGFAFIRCWIPFKKITENRNAHLLGYTNNLVWLNPSLNAAGAESILTKVNMKMCEVPVDKAQIKRVVKSIFKQKKDGTLKPIYNWKPRKIVFAPFSPLTREQKLAKCRELFAAHKVEESTKKLYAIIEEWDFDKYGKIGQVVIYKNFPISKKTVEKYWHEFKEYVADLNTIMGYVKTQKKATAQSKSIMDTVLSEEVKVSPEALNEVADIVYNFNDAGFNMVGITQLVNAVNGLPDDELVKLVLGIEDRYHHKPVGEVVINAGGVTYSFINDVTASLVRFNGVN